MQQNRRQHPERYVQSILHLVNNIPGYMEQWNEVENLYDEFFHFADKISDEDRIAEHMHINWLYNKYISEKRATILDNIDKPETLLTIITKWQDTKQNKPKGGWSRAFLCYITLIDKWLLKLKRLVICLVPRQTKNKEEE